MKFYSLINACGDDRGALQQEFKESRQIGKIYLGDSHFFFRAARRTYYIPYADIRRYFRRVMLVPVKMCCGRGNLPVEHLVICGDEGELAQIRLSDTQMAKVLMNDLQKLAPQAAAGRPAS